MNNRISRKKKMFKSTGMANDFVGPYLKAFLGFLGMTDLTVFRAEGLKLPGVKKHALEKGIASIAID